MSSLGWYLARARTMGPAEIGWRVATAARGAAGRARSRPRPAPVGELAFDEFREARGRPVVFDAARAAVIARDLPDQVDEVVRAADAVLDGEFAFFGQAPVRFPGPVDWNLDPRTGLRWPDRPAARVNHRTYGDPKWIWELNRLQHLPWLTQAWLFTGDHRYADAALDQLDSWLDQNPTGRGIAWRGGFEAGLRAMSVAVAVQGLRHAPAMTAQRYQRIATMLAESADMCWHERSRFSSANNHLLGELAGAATVAILHPELPAARHREQAALAALAREADRQILPDGAGAEQSSLYLIFSAQLLLVPAALLRLRGDRPPPALDAAVRRSAEFLAGLTAGGYPLPRYGDEDGGFALRLHPEPVAELSRHLALVDGALDDLAARWLTAPPTGSRPVVRARTGDWYAPHGGLVVLRGGGRRIIMDVGPLGYLSLAAHGHADALAVTLAADGHDLVGDPGTGSYYAEPTWRRAFRSTRMHATVAVDDLDQSVAGGPFLWTRHARTTVRAVDLERGVVEAEHDGYRRLDAPVTHRRYLVAPPGREEVLVLDLVEGDGHHRVRTSWPLHPDLEVEELAAGHLARRGGVPVLQVVSASTAPGVPYRVRGVDGLGWWSERFEHREPAWLVGSVVERARCPVAIATLLCPTGDRARAVDGLSVAREGTDEVEVTWTDGPARTVVRVDPRAPGAVSYELPVRT